MFSICSSDKVTFIHVYVKVVVYSVSCMCWRDAHLFLCFHLRNLVGSSECPLPRECSGTGVQVPMYWTVFLALSIRQFHVATCLHSTFFPQFVKDLLILSFWSQGHCQAPGGYAINVCIINVIHIRKNQFWLVMKCEARLK